MYMWSCHLIEYMDVATAVYDQRWRETFLLYHLHVKVTTVGTFKITDGDMAGFYDDANIYSYTFRLD